MQEAGKTSIRIDRHKVPTVGEGTLDLSTYPIIIIHATIEGMRRKNHHKDGRRFDRIDNTLVENTIFQFVKIEKYMKTLQLQFGFERSSLLCTVLTAVTDKNIVGFHRVGSLKV